MTTYRRKLAPVKRVYKRKDRAGPLLPFGESLAQVIQLLPPKPLWVLALETRGQPFVLTRQGWRALTIKRGF